MQKMIFVNLPVKDLKKSIEFFNKLGYKFNPQFTDENATAMIVDENITIMLLVEEFYKTFIKKPVADARKTNEVILSFSADNKAEVDKMVDAAFKAGAKPSNETQDYGWMYNRAFEDLDGHLWEYAWMDLSQMPKS